MSDWNYINKARIRTGPFRSDESDGFNGAFCFVMNGLPVKVIASDGLGWQHVSVSIDGSKNEPSWNLMCKIKDLFWNDNDWVVQFHPAKSEYVNNHPGCLHLWKPTGVELPKPDSILVGIKTTPPK